MYYSSSDNKVCFIHFHGSQAVTTSVTDFAKQNKKCYSDGDEINGTEFLDCCLRYGAQWGTCSDQ